MYMEYIKVHMDILNMQLDAMCMHGQKKSIIPQEMLFVKQTKPVDSFFWAGQFKNSWKKLNKSWTNKSDGESYKTVINYIKKTNICAGGVLVDRICIIECYD